MAARWDRDPVGLPYTGEPEPLWKGLAMIAALVLIVSCLLWVAS